MKNYSLIWLIMLLLSVSLASALTNTNFTTTTPGNLTLTGTNTETLYINVSSLSIITTATLTLTGHPANFPNNITGDRIDITSTIIYFSEPAGGDCTFCGTNNSFDNNLSTYVQVRDQAGGDGTPEVIYNFSNLGFQTNFLEIFGRIGTNNAVTPKLSCFNHTSGSYKIFREWTTPDPVVNVTYLLKIPDGCLNDDNIIIKFGTGDGGFTPGFFIREIELARINLTSNITIDTLNDSFIDYTKLGSFNGTVTNIDLNITAMNNWISTNCTSGWCSLPIRFESQTAGILEYSNLLVSFTNNITYLTNCTGGISSTRTLNFTLVNESDSASVTGTMELAFTHTAPTFNTSLNQSFAFDYSTSSHADVCINPADQRYITNATIQYVAPGFETHTYYLTGTTLTNITNNITLLLTDGTTGITFNVIDENDNPLGGVNIKILKYDVGTNTYNLVQILQTDFEGEAYGQLVLFDVWYKFILEQNGIVVRTTDGSKQLLTTRTFRINLLTDYLDKFDIRQGVISSLTFNNDTGNFVFTYNDPASEIGGGCLKVTKMSVKNEEIINETCSETTSATIIVNIGTAGDDTFNAVGWIHFDDVIILQQLSETFDFLWKNYGLEGLWYSFMLITSVTMLGMWHPVAGVAMLVGGFALTAIPKFGFLQLDWPFLVAFIILGSITIWKVNRAK